MNSAAGGWCGRQGETVQAGQNGGSTRYAEWPNSRLYAKDPHKNSRNNPADGAPDPDAGKVLLGISGVVEDK